MSLNLRPQLAIDDLLDGDLGDTKLAGEHGESDNARSVSRTDLAHLILGQFDMPAPPASDHTIVAVVLMCSSDEVARVAARRVVACVPDDRFFWMDGAISQYVRNPVSSQVERLAVVVGGELPVSAGASSCQPRPTGIRSTGPINLAPKPVNVPWSKLVEHCRSFLRCRAPGCSSSVGVFSVPMIPVAVLAYKGGP